MSTEFKFAQAGVDLIGKAEGQTATLQNAAKPFVQALLALDHAEQAGAANTFFLAARGEYVMLKNSGAKERATRMGKGWNNLRSAITYHLGTAGMVAIWPNWATGEGKVEIISKAEDKGRREEKKAENEARESEAIKAANDQRAALALAAIRELGPEDVALKIQELLDAWGGDQTAVLVGLVKKYQAESKKAA